MNAVGAVVRRNAARLASRRSMSSGTINVAQERATGSEREDVEREEKRREEKMSEIDSIF